MSKEKAQNKWIFLSHELSPALSAYGNGERVDILPGNRISKGNNSNSSVLKLTSHFGTHIDFPYHFSDEGPSGSDYYADDFIFKHIKLIDISAQMVSNYLIDAGQIPIETLGPLIEFLLIKTGFGQHRFSDLYWEKNPGLAPGLAAFFKDKMPGLRAVGFDLISLSSWQRRDIGRIAHKEFLVNHNILVIEDMDLSKVEETTCFETVIVSPLRFNNADGSPVTIFAEINNEN